MNFRRVKMGLATLLGRPAQGFFIPYRYADGIRPLGRQISYPALEQIMQDRKTEFAAFLEVINLYSAELTGFNNTEPPRPRWQQDWFPRLDGAAAYAMVRHHKPARIIEVGSGHSTRFMMQAISDEGLETRFHAIDPAPRADIKSLALSLSRKTVQQVDRDMFDGLNAGDFLFIDSSHIAMPGSDVDMLFLDVLPRLKPGVIVHIHDIFLPDGYPEAWEWREYNEHQAVAPLLFGGGFDLLFASHYAVSRMGDDAAMCFIKSLPIPPGAVETSLWLKRM